MTNMPSLLKTVCAQKLEASLYQYQFIEELHLYFGLFFFISSYIIFLSRICCLVKSMINFKISLHNWGRATFVLMVLCYVNATSGISVSYALHTSSNDRIIVRLIIATDWVYRVQRLVYKNKLTFTTFGKR